MFETTVPSPTVDRIRGCLLGGAIGDALGYPIEFSDIGRIRADFGPNGVTDLSDYGHGLVTDDTQMTLFTIDGLLRTDLKPEADVIVPAVNRAYRRWLTTQRENPPHPDEPSDGWLISRGWLHHRRAPGNACLSGLRQEPPPATAPLTGEGSTNPHSKGCGTVMRSAPFGLVWEPKAAFDLSARCSRLTHGHPTGYLAGGALAALVSVVARGGDLASAVETTLAILDGYPDHAETRDAILGAVRTATAGDPSPERVERIGGGWIAEEALAVALYCALIAETDGPHTGIKRALLLSVNHSGDSDSTGAVCGNLLGARFGLEALPSSWLAMVEHRDDIDAVAVDLADAIGRPGAPTGDSGKRRRRYPADAR